MKGIFLTTLLLSFVEASLASLSSSRQTAFVQGGLLVVPTHRSKESPENRMRLKASEEKKNPFSGFTDNLPFFQNKEGDDSKDEKNKKNVESSSVNRISESPQEILARLGIQPTEAKTAYVDPAKRLDIAGAAMPVSIVCLKKIVFSLLSRCLPFDNTLNLWFIVHLAIG